MANRLYILTLDITDPLIALEGMKSLLDQDLAISTWWNHIPGVFFIETEMHTDELTDKVAAAVGRGRFVLVEVKPETVGGYLPKASWRWLERRRAQGSEAVAEPAPSGSHA